MDRRPLQFALRETQAVFTSPRALVVLAAAALVLGLSGPFGTFSDFALPARLVYWLAVVVSTYVVGQAVALFALEALLPRLRAVVLRVGLAALFCSVPVTLIVLVINAIAYRGGPVIDPFRLWFYCLGIAAAVVTVLVVAGRGGATTAAADTATGAGLAAAGTAEPPATDAPPPILDRVPRPQRGRLLALSVKDHYVEIITDRGRALVLMRLSDAMRETGRVPGLQIHRSHWVALDAVRRVSRSGGKPAVELPDGERLPISRGYLPAARAAGLLA